MFPKDLLDFSDCFSGATRRFTPNGATAARLANRLYSRQPLSRFFRLEIHARACPRRNVLQIVYRLHPGEYSIIELGNELKA